MPVRLTLVAVALLLGACGSTAPRPVSEGQAPRAARVVGELAPGPGAQVEAVTFAIWSDGALSPEVLREARTHDGVVSAGGTASGIVRLRSAPSDDRAARSSVRRVSVLAADHAPLAFDPALSRVATSLESGHVAISSVAAQRREIAIGDRIAIGDDPTRVTVGALIADEALFSHELVVPLTLADALGLERSPAVIVAALPAEVPDTARDLVELAGDHARIRALAGYGEARGTVMSIEEIHRNFGRFRYVRGPGDSIVPDPAWVRLAIIDWEVPVLGRVRCHRNMVGQLAYAMRDIEAAGLGGMIESYDGCYVPRFQRLDDTTLSAHAYGIAIDLNAATNGQGVEPTLDPRIVEIMERWGFAWGGRFSVPDGMHFEISRMVRLPR